MISDEQIARIRAHPPGFEWTDALTDEELREFLEMEF